MKKRKRNKLLKKAIGNINTKYDLQNTSGNSKAYSYNDKLKAMIALCENITNPTK